MAITREEFIAKYGVTPEQVTKTIKTVGKTVVEPFIPVIKKVVSPPPSPPTEEPRWRLVGTAGTGTVEAPPPTLEQLEAEAGRVETAREEAQLRMAQLQGYLKWRPAPDVKTLRQYLEEGMRDAPPELHEAYRKKHEKYTEFYEEEYKPTFKRYQAKYGRYESAYDAFTHVEESFAAAEAGVMRGLVTEALEGKVPSWGRIWEPTKPLDVSQIQSSFLAPVVPSQEVIARRHLKNLVSLISGAPATEKEKIEALKIGIIKPSDVWQPPPKMVPAEAEKYFVGMPPKWYLGEAPTPGELQLQKKMEEVGEYFVEKGTPLHDWKKSLFGQIPVVGEIGTGILQAARPWGTALRELVESISKGGPALTGKVPILHEGPVFSTKIVYSPAERMGYIPAGFPVPKPPGLLSLETIGQMIFYAGAFKVLGTAAKFSAKGATYGFKAGARGTGIITKPLRAVARRVGPAAEAELVYTEFQLSKAAASMKGAVRGIFTTEPFYYYPRVGPAGQPTLTPMYKALDAMKQRLGIPKLPTIVSRAGRPGELARYRLGGLVKFEYVKPAPSITSYWDVPIRRAGVSPLASELVWVKDSMRVPTDLKLIVEPGGKLAEVQYWYKLIPTGKVKPIPYWDYMQSLRKAVGQTVSATRLSGFEMTAGQKVGTGYYWSLERLGVPPAEKAMGWFGVQTKGKIFPEVVSRAGVSGFVFDEQLIKLAAMFKKDKAVVGFISKKVETQASAVASGVRSYADKMKSFFAKGERFRVSVHPGPSGVGDGVLAGYGPFEGMRQYQSQLLAQKPMEALEQIWEPWLFPESSQLGITATGLGVGIGTAIGAGNEAATSTVSGLKLGALSAAGVRQLPRMGQIPFFELAPFQAQVSGVGVTQAQATVQAQKSALAQMRAQMQQMTKATFTPFVFPYGELKKKRPLREQKITMLKFKPFERVWPVGRIERLFMGGGPKVPKFKMPKFGAPKAETKKVMDAFDMRGLGRAFKVPKMRARRR